MKENLLFISTLENKIYKHMTWVLKNVYIDKLDDIVIEYNNTYHRTIKMKYVDVKDNLFIESINDINDKDLKFKVDDHARISKYKNIFAKGYPPNWSEEVFVINKLRILFHGNMLLMIIIEKKILEHFMKKNCNRQIKIKRNLEYKK